MKRAQPNETVSSGTLSNADLIPRFCDWLENLPATSDHLRRIQVIRAQFLKSDEEAEWTFDELFDMVSDYAPPGYCFGTHIGDGCLYGFWKDN